MSGLRPRGMAGLCGLLLLTGLLTAVPAASAGAAPTGTSPSVITSALRSASVTPAEVQRNARYAPPANFVPAQGASFAYLRLGRGNQKRIRNQVLATINSTWGGPRDRHRLAWATNGTIRISTWSFGDMGIAKALVAAHRRGVSVQVIGASDINKTHRPFKWLKKKLGSRWYIPGVAGSQERSSFVRACRGSCRGRGGTPHSKFFLFDKVGAARHGRITFQTSMNLTAFAWNGQWNQSYVTRNSATYDQFLLIFRESRFGTYVGAPYRVYTDTANSIQNVFFPFPGASSRSDPVMQQLNRVSCTGSSVTSGGRTRIRIINYAIYQARGEWIARKLRSLWQAGCDVAIIYAVTTRPSLSILRSGAGRGPIPMKQSIIKGRDGRIVKYNHSKWMTIAGNYNGRPNAFITMAGSANWANLSLGSDEQMQVIDSLRSVQAHNQSFATTWNQPTSGRPTLNYVDHGGRVRPLPETNIPWGKGIYKHMTPYG